MGLDLLVEFEFRTTRTTGVLLGISSQKMDGMGIEMIDEKVSVSFLNISDFLMIALFICKNVYCEALLYSLLGETRVYLFILLDYLQCMFSIYLLCRPV